MTPGPLSTWDDQDPGKKWGKMVAFSLLLHSLLLVFFINLIPSGKDLRPLESAYRVDLVSWSQSPTPGDIPAGGPALQPPAKAVPLSKSPPLPVKPVAISKPPVPVEKKIALPDEPKSLDLALERLKKKIDQEKSLERSFNRLENKVKNQEALDQTLARLERKAATETRPKGAAAGSGPGGEGGISSSGPAGGPGVGLHFQMYHASLRARIKKNWVLPEGLLKKSDISADISIRIGRNGKLEGFQFERKSGVASFDQEVVRTLQKSDPLPPLPEGYPRGMYEVVLTFHSKDLGGN